MGFKTFGSFFFFFLGGGGGLGGLGLQGCRGVTGLGIVWGFWGFGFRCPNNLREGGSTWQFQETEDSNREEWTPKDQKSRFLSKHHSCQQTTLNPKPQNPKSGWKDPRLQQLKLTCHQASCLTYQSGRGSSLLPKAGLYGLGWF